MNKKEMEKYKQILLMWKERIFNELHKLENENLGKSQKEFSGDLSGYSLHMADAGTDTFDREFALGLVSNQQEFLYEIDQALARIEDKTFAVCETCEKEIPLKRLNALPFARNCIKCQETLEKK